MKQSLLLSTIAIVALIGNIGCDKNNENKEDETITLDPSYFSNATVANTNESTAVLLLKALDEDNEATDLSENIEETPNTTDIDNASSPLRPQLKTYGDGTHTCQNGGSVSMAYDLVKLAQKKLSITTTFDHCKTETNATWNGKIAYTIQKDEANIITSSQTMLTDFNYTGPMNHTIDMVAGTHWSFKNNPELSYVEVEKSYVIIIDGNHTIGAEDWVQRRFKPLQAGKAGWYPIKGKIYFDNMRHFITIDENYNHSETPYLLNIELKLYDGTARYRGDKNRGIQIDITGVGSAEVTFDLNKDGNYTDGPMTISY